MKTIEPDEVMLRDFVKVSSKHYDGIGQISGVEPTEGSLKPRTFSVLGKTKTGESLLTVGVRKRAIEGIPLNDDILKKIGFSLEEVKDGLYKKYSIAVDIESIPQSIVQVTVYDHPIYGIDTLVTGWCRTPDGEGQNDFHICNIRFVHELQHALKLIGIKMKIEL